MDCKVRNLNEFNNYAKGYSGGMENPIKRLLAKDLDSFIEIKAKWIIKNFEKESLTSSEISRKIRLLDFGCGTGILLRSLQRLGFKGDLEGCDVSKNMLEEAIKQWQNNNIPPLYLMGDLKTTTLKENSYDIVIASCVFHHIDSFRQFEVLKEIKRILKPGGRIIIFEHNPINFFTKLVIATTPIDRNAVLITPHRLNKMLKVAGLIKIKINYILFFPPRFHCQCLKKIEQFAWWIPFGGQYVFSGEKPEK